MKVLVVVLFLPSVFYGDLVDCDNSYLKKYLNLAVSLRDGNDREKFDSYFENEVPILLDNLIFCMDEGFDKEKAKIFFDFHLSMRGHASKDVTSYFYKLFVKFQKETREAILTYSKEDSLYLAKCLIGAWNYSTYGIVHKNSSKEPPKELRLLLQQLNIPVENQEGIPTNEGPERPVKKQEFLPLLRQLNIPLKPPGVTPVRGGS